MKMLSIIFIALLFLSGCSKCIDAIVYSDINYDSQESSAIETLTVSTFDTVSATKSLNETIKATIDQNADIVGGMCVDLNFDGVDEVVFLVNTSMGEMYTINYFNNNELTKTGEIYYWGHWIAENEVCSEISVYKYNDNYFYCTEKIYSIKDVTSAVGIEMIAYYQIADGQLPYEANILTYVNTDCSDEVTTEMNMILNRTRKKIEDNCDLLKSISIEIQWTRDDLSVLDKMN